MTPNDAFTLQICGKDWQCWAVHAHATMMRASMLMAQHLLGSPGDVTVVRIVAIVTRLQELVRARCEQCGFHSTQRVPCGDNLRASGKLRSDVGLPIRVVQDMSKAVPEAHVDIRGQAAETHRNDQRMAQPILQAASALECHNALARLRVLEQVRNLPTNDDITTFIEY